MLHKEQVVAELIATLTELDIHPTTLDSPVVSIHVESRSVRMRPVEEGQSDLQLENDVIKPSLMEAQAI